MWISGGDHEIASNIVHLVLARVRCSTLPGGRDRDPVTMTATVTVTATMTVTVTVTGIMIVRVTMAVTASVTMGVLEPWTDSVRAPSCTDTAGTS
jgi:hypothetical protein